MHSPLTGGWEETFKNKVDSNTFYGIQLEVRSRRSNSHNQYVSERRSFDAVRLEIIQALRNFLEERLRLKDDLGDVLNSFSKDKISQLSDEQISLVQHHIVLHQTLRDLFISVTSLKLIFENQSTISTLTQQQLLQKLILLKDDTFKPLILVFSSSDSF